MKPFNPILSFTKKKQKPTKQPKQKGNEINLLMELSFAGWGWFVAGVGWRALLSFSSFNLWIMGGATRQCSAKREESRKRKKD